MALCINTHEILVRFDLLLFPWTLILFPSKIHVYVLCFALRYAHSVGFAL